MTEKDVREIFRTCRKTREKSFVAMLYLSGCRCSELLNLRMKDVTFDGKGAIFMVNGTKTAGSKRRIRITSGMDILKAWTRQHPDPKPDALVWLMGYWQARNMIRKLACRMKAKGFSKRIHAHAFRHARATYLAGQGLNSFQLMSMFGWNKPETANWYISLSGKQLDDSLCALPRMVF